MTGPEKGNGAPQRNMYGRRRGKTLRKGQVKHLETTLQVLSPDGISWEDNPTREALDLSAMFGGPRQVRLEIGFGGGEHLLHMAQRHPEIGFIGCEPYINGVAMLLPRIAELGIKNIRIHAGDARDLLDVLPIGSLERVYLLYPDPWPKLRHHRRRFINAEQIEQLARVVKAGGLLRIATDIPDYVRHCLEHFQSVADFDWMAEQPENWREPWPNWYRTRYEAKAIRENRTPHYLSFVRT